MAYPTDIKIIDCMLGIPEAEDRSDWFTSFRPLIKDAQTLQQFSMPAQYMFNVPDLKNIKDGRAYTLAQMDQHGISRAMVGISGDPGLIHEQAVAEHPDRFFASYEANPNLAMDEAGDDILTTNGEEAGQGLVLVKGGVLVEASGVGFDDG